MHIHGRLSPGVGVAQASAAVSAVTSQLAREYPATNEFKAGVVAPYHADRESRGRRHAGSSWPSGSAMAALPLLVVCLNVSGMVQVRSAMRERELSIRQAIGASRGRLIQHLLAEAVVLAALGGALASLVLFNVPPLMSWWLGEPIPAQLAGGAQGRPVACSRSVPGLCLATSLVFGWLPALRFSRPVIMTVLKDEAGSGGVRAGRVHRLTTALQVAIAVPLLVLSVMSLERVRATATADLGFACRPAVRSAAQLEAARPRTPVSRSDRSATLSQRASGVASVTVADGLPLDFRYRMARVSTQTEANVAPKVASAHVTRVGDGYLDTMGIALVRGRGFSDR